MLARPVLYVNDKLRLVMVSHMIKVNHRDELQDQQNSFITAQQKYICRRILYKIITCKYCIYQSSGYQGELSVLTIFLINLYSL